MLAASYGMPRIVLLRQLGTAPHLARAIAAIQAEDMRRQATEAAEAQAKKAQEEAEMRAYLEQLKAEQAAARAETT